MKKMIDFIKIQVKHPDISGIRNNPRLDWDQRTNEKTGEVKQCIAVYNGMAFQIVGGQYLNISGSLHKHWNSINGLGEQNYNDFDRYDLLSTGESFCKTFNLNPDNCIIENFEFGENITPPLPSNKILDSAIHHKGNPFNWKRTLFMNYLECEHRQYYVKFYDKGLQFNQGEILRFETKTRKMEYVSRAKIGTLSDLLKCENLTILGSMLADNFSLILFDDPTVNTSAMNQRDGLTIEQCRNPKFWESLKPDNYFKKRNRFRELCRKYGSLDIQEKVHPLIVEKWNALLRPKGKTLQELTGVSGGGEKPNITGIDTSNIGSNPVKLDMNDPVPGSPPRRYCLSCGRDISDQRIGSKFCSAKYIGYVEAHRCRNRDSNPRNRIRCMKELEKVNPPLFDTDTLFIKYRKTTIKQRVKSKVA